MEKTYTKTETHEITEEHEVGRNIFCDCCGKQIETKQYIQVTKGSREQGSVDGQTSSETIDLCSPACLLTDQKKFFGINAKSFTAYYKIHMKRWDNPIYEEDGTEQVFTDYHF